MTSPARTASSGSSPIQTGRRKAQTRPGKALAGRVGPRRGSRSRARRPATRAPGAVHSETQRSTAPSGRQTAPKVQPSDVAERGEHAVAERVGLEAGGEMVGDRLLGAEQPVRAADAAAHPRLLELAGQHAGELREVGRRSGRPREAAQDRGELAGRMCGETATNGRCGSASRTSASALRDGTA